MIYLKSFLAGLAALAAYILLFLLAIRIWMDRLVKPRADLSAGDSDIVSPTIPLSAILIGAVLAFLAASGWTFRRISSRRG